MKRSLGGTYQWLTRAYPSTSINAAGQRSSCWWMTTPSFGNREHPFQPLDPSTITEPVSIKTIPPNGVVNRLLSAVWGNSLWKDVRHWRRCAQNSEMSRTARQIFFICLCSTCLNTLRSDRHRTKFVAADCATLRVARQRHMLGSMSVVCDLYIYLSFDPAVYFAVGLGPRGEDRRSDVHPPTKCPDIVYYTVYV